jgi:hypothetical protein
MDPPKGDNGGGTRTTNNAYSQPPTTLFGSGSSGSAVYWKIVPIMAKIELDVHAMNAITEPEWARIMSAP